MRWKVQVWELVKEGLVGHTVEGFLQVDEDTPDTHPPLKERVASVHSNYVGNRCAATRSEAKLTKS